MPQIDLEILTGPPRIGGTLFPIADVESPVEGMAVDESRYKTLANGHIKKVGVERYRLRWTLGWRVLTQSQMQSLLNIIKQKEGFSFTPRTYNPPNDPESASPAENTYQVRLLSDIPLTTRLMWDHYGIEIELETIDIIEGQEV